MTSAPATLTNRCACGNARPPTSHSVFTNAKGGIIDDTVITRVADDEIYMVVNAGCREKDLAHLGAQLADFQVRHVWMGGWVGW